MRGGWQNISAEESTLLATLGCTQPFHEGITNVFQPLWTGFDESAAAAGSSGGTFQTATIPAPTEGKIVNLAQFFAGSDIDTNPVDFTGFLAQGGILPEIVRGVTGAVAGELAEQAMQGMPQFGVTVTPGQACWDQARATGKVNSRMRVKLQRLPDGTVQVVRYCAPRRMNPCNPRALGRAARRLSAFQRMSSGIEKIINRQLKRKGPVRRSYGSCAPKRGCR
jgi:hypothetical protein